MDRYCCARIAIGTWNDVRCKNKPKYEYEGKSYCATHYPPNVAERKRKLREKWSTEALAYGEHLSNLAIKEMEDRGKLADYERLVRENAMLKAELERLKG